MPHPLPTAVNLQSETWQAIARAHYALGMLKQGSSLVPNPSLLRRPALRREAQSTSALEGTFAPIEDVIAADMVDEEPRSLAMREILNYVRAAEYAIDSIATAPLSVSLLRDLHRMLIRGTDADGAEAGRVRSVPVAIGPRGGSIYDARFVPPPPGIGLESGVNDLVQWIRGDERPAIDPVVAAALAHYQFETLHPFNDGNGRIGRLLIVLQLMQDGVVKEPLLTVSPWFEARRDAYQTALSEVSASGDWDQWVSFFAEGIAASATTTADRLHGLLQVQARFHSQLQAANIRGVARDIVDVLIRDPYVTITHLSRMTGRTYQAVSNAVVKLEDLGILQLVDKTAPKMYRAPEVLAIALR